MPLASVLCPLRSCCLSPAALNHKQSRNEVVDIRRAIAVAEIPVDKSLHTTPLWDASGISIVGNGRIDPAEHCVQDILAHSP